MVSPDEFFLFVIFISQKTKQIVEIEHRVLEIEHREIEHRVLEGVRADDVRV